MVVLHFALCVQDRMRFLLKQSVINHVDDDDDIDDDQEDDGADSAH